MLISKSLILEKITKKVTDYKLSNSLHHRFGNQHTETAEQASQIGLKYLGFGRYGKDGKVTHIVKNKKLVQIAQNDKEILSGLPKYDETHIDKDMADFHKKAKPLPVKQHNKASDGVVSRYYRDRGQFAKINEYLHNLKDDNIDKVLHKKVFAFDKFIAGEKLDNDLVVYTGAGTSLKDGGILHTKGYRAATSDYKKAEKAGSDVIELHLKKGKPAAVVDNDEVILPRDHKIRIVGQPIKIRDKTVWKAELM